MIRYLNSYVGSIICSSCVGQGEDDPRCWEKKEINGYGLLHVPKKFEHEAICWKHFQMFDILK